MRETWLTHALTDWMGDDGWLLRLRCEHRKFNYIGDTTWVRGRVVDKVQADGRNEVHLEVGCWNQRGEETTPGTAVVLLPTRERAVELPAAPGRHPGRAARGRDRAPRVKEPEPLTMNHGAQVDFELTEEQAALREVSRGLLAVNCPPQLVRSLAAAGQDVDEKLWQRGAELGWTGLAVPEELDGAGQGVVELCLVAEELGRAAAPGPFLDSALTALALARAGRRAELVGSLAAGEVKASVAHHGAVTGSWDGDELVLSGRATAVQAAASADWLLVTVAVGDGGRRLVLVRPVVGIGRAAADAG